jgi:predicted HicB family RNase H-like nuclease
VLLEVLLADCHDGFMSIDPDAMVQLATRIPKALHRNLKLHCVTDEVTVMDFVIQAVTEKLKRDTGRKRRS